MCVHHDLLRKIAAVDNLFLSLAAARRGEQHTLGHINTRIPELRLWIDAITRPTRETVAEQVLQQTKDFARCIETWIDGIPGVSLGDRDRLKACWRSKKSPEGPKGKNQLSHRQLLQRRYQSSPETAIIPALLKVNPKPGRITSPHTSDCA